MAGEEEPQAVTTPPSSSPLEGSLEGSLEDGAGRSCQVCDESLTEPRVLACLHVFCRDCLQKIVEEESHPVDDEPTKLVEAIACPTCKQETLLPVGGVDKLVIDYVMSDLLDMSAVEDLQIICTSCKAKEKAVARCADCANFLCPNCVTAHQFMRCFENHKVVTFEDMKASEGIAFHKPIFCPNHPEENLRYFCTRCQNAVCTECMLKEHPQAEHHCEKLTEVEARQTEELKTLLEEGRGKLEKCRETSQALESALSELQEQTDNAKGLIEETFQSYKALLEKRKDDMLKELEEKHSTKELQLMETFHVLGTSETRLDDALSFTERVLKHGNSTHIALMKKLICSQLLSLINNSPKADMSVKIEFKTSLETFENALSQTFGWFIKEEPVKSFVHFFQNQPPSDLQLSSIHSPFESEAAYNLAAGMLSPEDIVSGVTDSDFLPGQLQGISPLAALNGNLEGLSNLVSVASSLGGAPPMPPLDSSLSRASLSPAMSDSGISVDAGSTNSNNSATLMNIAAMAKLGSVGMSGQAILGSLNSVSSSTASVSGISGSSSRTHTPMSQAMDSSLRNSILSVSTSQSVQPTNLETLASLLNNQPPTPGLSSMPFSSMGSMGTMDPISPVPGSGGDLGSGELNSPTGSNFSGSGASLPYPPVRRANKMSAMQIRCKFGQLGPGKCQFNSPHGFCLGVEQDIIVADTNNHRIQVFEKSGEFKYQFGIPGREEGQLWYPRKVAVMRASGKFVVCDRGNERSRMQIFTRNGHFIKKIAIRYIDIVAGLAITQHGHIVAVDSVSPTVFCISEAGDLIKWFDCSDYMREPSDIAVSGKEYFVCDFKGHCVVVFNEEGQFMRRIGCENITNYPNGIDISDAGDVLVGDSHGNRFHVAVFQRDGSLIGEFQCPYVKVSRCCGLKITSEGYIVTLAKNNHHVLVLNTLYIT